jgi:hypothetical protein
MRRRLWFDQVLAELDRLRWNRRAPSTLGY